MYEIAKTVIMRRDYDLSDMIIQLKSLRLSGDITDEQLTELMELARSNADPAMSIDIMARIEDHETRLRAIEQGSAEPPAPGTYPEYVTGQPARNGEIYMWQGKAYKCVLPEHVDVCVWSPDAYPAYWQLVRDAGGNV